MRFYGDGADELHLAMNFPFVFAAVGPEMRAVVGSTEAAIHPAAWPAWSGSNHDVGRFPTRWCDGDDRRIRAALLVLLTLRGTPLLYYGDEIGMQEHEVPPDRIRDRIELQSGSLYRGRDRARTPMPWTGEPTGGFSGPGVEPWLPAGDPRWCNVADQRDDPRSVLHLCRDLIALRRTRPDLRTGAYAPLDGPDEVWAWRRGEGTIVAVNCSEAPVHVALGAGDVLVGTLRERDGRPVDDPIRLEPWEALILAERTSE
jgi:alpha-glucosidase